MDILLNNKLDRKAAELTAAVNSKPVNPGMQMYNYGKSSFQLPYACQMMTNEQGTVRVCAANACMSGCCCLFTVPAGVTDLQFQIWGGGGNGTGCCAGQCCIVGINGASGEYKYIWISGVKEGQQFTLCAGGAYLYGACYSYCDCNGCTSFICSTTAGVSLVACGGRTGYNMTCGLIASEFRENSDNVWWTGNTPATVCNNSFCYGMNRHMTASDGYINPPLIANCLSVKSYTNVPSHFGTWQKCDTTNYTSVCTFIAPIVLENGYGVCKQYAGWCGYNFGCCWDTCGSHNYAGMAGVGMNMSCNYSSTTGVGARGRAGAIIVKYC